MSHPRRRILALTATIALLITALAPAGALSSSGPQKLRPTAAPAWVTDNVIDPLNVTRGAGPALTAANNPAPADPNAAPADPNAAPADPNAAPADGSAATAPVEPLVYNVGDFVYAVTVDTVFGLYPEIYEVRAIGTNIEVWVQLDMSFYADDPSDPRPTPEVTDAQIAYLVDEFDNNIFPKESDYWRTPELRNGSNAVLDDLFGLDPDSFMSFDGKDRVIAKIENIEDDNFYDPTYPLYVAGFFSPDVNFYIDRNVITIDALDWANRVGGPGAPWRPADGPDNDVDFLYESTFAHEYQHLLHGDEDAAEESWINEGLSMWTEWLVGYGVPQTYVDEAQENGENSLVIWGDQGDVEIITDYGEAFLFMHYLYTHYGQGAMQALFHSQFQGMAGVNDALKTIKAKTTFADVYHNFAIARLVLSDKPGKPKGIWNIPDITSPVVLKNADGTINGDAFDTPGAPPFGSDYLLLKDPNKIKKLVFDGLDMLTLDTEWTVVDDPLGIEGKSLWSGGGDEKDRFAIFSTTGGGSLDFDTLYDLEEQWDFGVVQVSTDDGLTWTSLANGDTRSDIVPQGYPKTMDNLPGFTGISGGGHLAIGWDHETFNLSAYAGQSILIGFRLLTDWGFNGNLGDLANPNWYIDNVQVDGVHISDGTDASAFKHLTFYQPIDLNFTVDLVTRHKDWKGKVSYRVFHIFTTRGSEMSRPIEVRDAVANCDQAVLIVTFDALQGEQNYAPYEIKIVTKSPKQWPHDPPHWYVPRPHGHWLHT